MSGRRTKQKRAAESRAYLRKYLHAYVGVLRHILKRHGLPTGTSPPCHSCAFNPSTDKWVGFESTMIGLIDCFETGKPFVCHEGLPRDPDTQAWHLDPRQPAPPLCAGFVAIRDDPETKRACLIALRDVGQPPPYLIDAARRRRSRTKEQTCTTGK